MTTMRTLRPLIIILACAISLSGNGEDSFATRTHTFRDPQDVPEGLAKSDWQSIRAAYEAGRHAFMPIEGGWQARNPGQQWTTKFDGRGFITQPRGVDWQWGLELKSYGFAGEEQRVGGAESKPEVSAKGQRLTYAWDEILHEWFVNDTRGLEHGFTVNQRPPCVAEVPLRFDLAVRGTLMAQVAADGQGVEFRDASGATVLNYTGLKVWDADGKVLVSHFEANGAKMVRLLVDEQGARYPLTIDPIAQQAYLKATNNGSLNPDEFGTSVAVSGDTVVVGAPKEDSSTSGVNSLSDENAPDSGAVYVFSRSGTTWSQQAYLKASNTGSSDYFGNSVAVSGDTVVVGALYEDSSTTGVDSASNEIAIDSGAAYIFVRSGTTWSQQAYVKASNTGGNDQFGNSVSVAGDTVVVGALYEDSSTTGVNSTPNETASNSGAAYVFARSGTTWSQQAYLKASNTGTSDYFGTSVAVSGDTVVVGAPEEDTSTAGINGIPNNSAADSGAAYVFIRSGTTWSQQAFFKATNTGAGDGFGFSVAASGDTVVVGSPREDSSTTGVNSTPNESAGTSGAGYIFVRSGTTWSQQAYVKASNTGGNDQFGNSVSVAGDTVVVGALYEDSSTTGVNSTPNETASNSGAAYVFARSGTTWSQQAYVKASNTGSFDYFGTSVAVSGDTVVVGAQNEGSSQTSGDSEPNDLDPSSGAAYVFNLSGANWGEQDYLKATNTAFGPGVSDYFGTSVTVSDDTVVVGAPYEDSSTTGVNSIPNENAIDSGAAYVFTRTGTMWSQQAYIKASNTGAGDLFGWSVALSGETLAVGASREDSSTLGLNSVPTESGPDSGAAYVFTRVGTTWTQQAYMKSGNTGSGDQFGISVAVSDDTIVVGALLEDGSKRGVNQVPDEGALDSGAAYIFVRNGTNWSQQAYVKAANSQSFDGFGNSVSVSANTVVVGAYQEDSNSTGVNSVPNEAAADSGAAYVFTRSGTIWTQEAYFKASNQGPSDKFGTSVGVSGDVIVVGAPEEDGSATGVNGTANNNASESGAAYVFTRSGTTWRQKAYLKANNTGVGDYFGTAVAVSGDTIVVGAPYEDSSTTGVNSVHNDVAGESGAAYVFTRSGTAEDLDAPWDLHAYLKASNTDSADFFGISVMVSDDTVVCGVSNESSSTTGVNSNPDNAALRSGSAYIYDGFPVPPAVGSVTIASNNPNTSVAKLAETVTLNFTASEPIYPPSVTLLGVVATVTNTFGNNWTATAAVGAGTAEGDATFSISVVDLTGNSASPVTATTDASSVRVDKTLPSMAEVTITSNNSSQVLARQGNDVTLSFTTSERINTPSVTLLGVPVTAINSSGNNWNATTSVVAGSSEGVVMFSISAVDIAGNAASAVTMTTDASSVTVDKTSPILFLPSGIVAKTNTPVGRTVNFVVSATDSRDPSPIVSVTPPSGSAFPVGMSVVNAIATDSAGNTSQGSFEIMVNFVLPEMTVRGNGQLIVDGDVTPSATDHTDFGTVALTNEYQRRTFLIGNSGDDELNLTASPLVEISGPGSKDFHVTVLPRSPVVPNGNTAFEVTFNPTLSGLRTATVSIVSDDLERTPYTFKISGFGLMSAALSQTIAFTAPSAVYRGQDTVLLNAYATSGLPVTLSVVSGPATIDGNLLTLNGAGTVNVQATQGGDLFYKSARPVNRSLTVRADPTEVTIVNLSQVYDSLPKSVMVLGATTPFTVSYKIGGTFVSSPPTNAGSYDVQAVAGGVTKNGTLVITKTPLYITPDDKRKFAGQPNPVLTLLVTGYQGMDAVAGVLTTPVALTTTAKINSPGGLYPIKSSGGASANYAIIHRPGTLVVESFAGQYEALLVDGSALPVGKLNVSVASTDKSFTGKLLTAREADAISLSGSVTMDLTLEQCTGTASVRKNGVRYDVTFIADSNGDLSATVTRDLASHSSATDGRKLRVFPSAVNVSYFGVSTVILEPATVIGPTVPAGAGWAQATTSTKGVLKLTGKLGDATAFTASVSPDGEVDPGYRLFVQPYKVARSGAYLAGAFRQEVSSSPVGTREMRGVAGAPLTWVKAGLPSDSSYRTSFGPVTTMMTMDPWLKPVGSNTLAVRLGLTTGTFRIEHSNTESLSDLNLPSSVALSAKNVVSVLLPTTAPPNITKWKTTINASLGTFTGSFELLDVTQRRMVPFSGVLRQPASSADNLIGDGHFLLPALNAAPSNEKVSGEVMFLR